MKRYYFLIILLVSGLAVFMSLGKTDKSDSKSSYKVIKINGRILFVKTKQDMQKGDEFKPGTPLDFIVSTSRAAVIKQSVRFVLQANSKGKVKILPATSNVTSRSGALINLIDLKRHFTGRYLIFDDEKLQIGKDAFPMDKTHFFYVKYDYKGESIAKVLDYNDNYLLLNKEKIFMVDGEGIALEEKEMLLYYRDDENKMSYKISAFTPVFPDLIELKSEIDILLSSSKELSVEHKMSEITSYLNDFYGKPQKENMATWLAKEFGIELEKNINFK
jgi:hypothetical protein